MKNIFSFFSRNQPHPTSQEQKFQLETTFGQMESSLFKRLQQFDDSLGRIQAHTRRLQPPVPVHDYSKFQNQISSLEDKLTRVEYQLSGVRKELKRTVTENKQLVNELNKIEGRTQTSQYHLQYKIKEEKAKVYKLQKQMEMLKIKMEEILNKRKHQNKMMSNLEGNYKRIQKESINRQKQLRDFQEGYKVLLAEYNKAKTHIRQMSQQILKSNELARRVKKKQQQILRQKQRLQNTIENMKIRMEQEIIQTVNYNMNLQYQQKMRKYTQQLQQKQSKQLLAYRKKFEASQAERVMKLLQQKQKYFQNQKKQLRQHAVKQTQQLKSNMENKLRQKEKDYAQNSARLQQKHQNIRREFERKIQEQIKKQEELQQKYQSLQYQSSAKKQFLQSELSQYSSSLGQLQRELQMAENSLKQKTLQIMHFQQTIEKLQYIIHQKEGKNAKNLLQIQLAKQESSILQQKLRNSQLGKGKLKVQLDKLRQLYNGTIQEKKKIEKQIQQKMNQTHISQERLKKELEQVKNSLHVSLKTQMKVQKQIQTINQQKSLLEKSKEQAERQGIEAKNEINNLKIDLKDRIDNQQLMYDHLTGVIDKQHQKHVTLAQKFNKLLQEFRTLGEENDNLTEKLSKKKKLSAAHKISLQLQKTSQPHKAKTLSSFKQPQINIHSKQSGEGLSAMVQKEKKLVNTYGVQWEQQIPQNEPLMKYLLKDSKYKSQEDKMKHFRRIKESLARIITWLKKKTVTCMLRWQKEDSETIRQCFFSDQKGKWIPTTRGVSYLRKYNRAIFRWLFSVPTSTEQQEIRKANDIILAPGIVGLCDKYKGNFFFGLRQYFYPEKRAKRILTRRGININIQNKDAFLKSIIPLVDLIWIDQQ